jgi:hypothetical protein
MLEDREPDVSDVVEALEAPRRRAGALHSGKQQRQQRGDHGDRHEKLNQRESSLVPSPKWNTLTLVGWSQAHGCLPRT